MNNSGNSRWVCVDDYLGLGFTVGKSYYCGKDYGLIDDQNCIRLSPKTYNHSRTVFKEIVFDKYLKEIECL